jgi:hypothetical protein
LLKVNGWSICLAAALLWAPLAAQSVPQLISYQGQLNDQSGAPVNGSIGLVFSIYDVPTGGAALWTETQTVQVSNGVFNVQLGAAQPVPTSLFEKEILYLGIKAGGDSEMMPRQRMTTSAFSYRSEGVAPIGSIIAWNKSMPGTPALPEGWVECNGQAVVDPDSPYNNETVPDLNGQGLLLSGGGSSGSTRMENYVPPHTHAPGGMRFKCNSPQAAYYSGSTGYGGLLTGDTASTTSGTPLTAFQIVWIMRIK